MKKTKRKLQIGVMGSCSDLKYSKKIEELAEEVGYWIAKSNAALLFGAEKDIDSLSTAACRGAKKANGLTIGITYGKGKEIVEKNVDIVIPTGMERGGGREFVLALSCDAIITISGGSGTLNEMVVAYQANIPLVALQGTGGWSENLAGKFIDSRDRVKVEIAKTPKEAVELTIKLAKKSSHHNQSF